MSASDEALKRHEKWDTRTSCFKQLRLCRKLFRRDIPILNSCEPLITEAFTEYKNGEKSTKR